MRWRRAAACVSLVVAVGVVVVWNVSFWRELEVSAVKDTWMGNGFYSGYSADLRVGRGGVAVGLARIIPSVADNEDERRPWEWVFQASRQPVYPSAKDGGGVAGFQWISFERKDLRQRALVVPLWAVGVVLSVLPISEWRVWRRERVAAMSLAVVCEGCGYDLRASPARCPECGREVANG